MRRVKIIYACYILLIVGACEPSGKSPSDMSPQELVQSREIKKVSAVDILESAKEKGNQLTDLVQKSYMNQLSSMFANEGLAHAIQYCNLNALPTIDSINKIYNAEIKRTSIKSRNNKNVPSQIEAEILQAYAYSVEQNLPISESVQILENSKDILYTKPIVLNNPMCLNCHGTIGKDITSKNYEVIQKLYPNDSAIDYSLNELRGMWSIKFSKKQIISTMN